VRAAIRLHVTFGFKQKGERVRAYAATGILHLQYINPARKQSVVEYVPRLTPRLHRERRRRLVNIKYDWKSA